MTLRAKTLVIMVGALAALLGGVYLTASAVLLRGFGAIDEQSARSDLRAVLRLFDQATTELEETARAWAGREDLYDLAGGGREPQALTRSVANALGAEDLDLVVVLGETGQPLLARFLDWQPEVGEPLPGGLSEVFAADGPLVIHRHTESRRSGIVMLASGPLHLASCPLVGEAGAGPIRGAVVIGRMLTEARWQALAAAAQATLAVRAADEDIAPEDFAFATATPPAPGRTLVRPLAGGWMASYAVLADIHGQKALVLRVEVARLVLTQGEATLRVLIGSLLLVALGFGLLPYLLVERLVLARLARVNREVATIGAARDPSARLTVGGGDELADLATAINQTLAALEEAQREGGESESRYRAMFEQALEGVFLVDLASRRFLEANAAFLRFLGRSAPELESSDLFEVGCSDDAKIAEDLARVQREGRCYLGERAFCHRDGSHVVLELAASLVTLRGRDVMCGFARDTSERRHIEEQLRHVQKTEAVGRLAGGVAHDVNNLLQVVQAGIERLRARGAEPATREQVTETLLEQVARGGALTRDLLVIARQESFRAESLELNALVAEAGAFLRRVVRENVRIDLDLAVEPLHAIGDRARLQQALMNLVVSAAEAIPGGGELVIRTGRGDGDEVWFEVTDSGPGIPDELRPRVFEPFFTAPGAGSAGGLGLPVVDGIIAEHGGRVDVTSTPGAGATFRVSLPLRDAGAPPAEHVCAVDRHPAGATGGSVLLVEDEEGAREGLRDMLVMLGYEVVAVGTGEEAQTRAAELPFDLLLTDFMLPGVSGSELARRLMDRRPGLSVVVMSGYAEDEAIRGAVAAGRVRFLPKPFGMERLRDELRAALATEAEG